MAYILKTDGKREQLDTPRKFKLEEIQRAVEGYIEAVPNTNHRVWCNEDGLRLQLPLNRTASHQYGMALVGNVFVLEKGDKFGQ